MRRKLLSALRNPPSTPSSYWTATMSSESQQPQAAPFTPGVSLMPEDFAYRFLHHLVRQFQALSSCSGHNPKGMRG